MSFILVCYSIVKSEIVLNAHEKNDHYLRAVNKLINTGAKSEKTRQNAITGWLDAAFPEIDVELEYPTDTGSIDIYLPTRRIIIEVKISDKLKNGPHETGSGSGHPSETAYEQLARYIDAERHDVQTRLTDYESSDKNTTWIGCVTDGRLWWVWEWDHTRHTDGREIDGWQGTRLSSNNIKYLERLFDRQVGKPWAPADSSDMFTESLRHLRNLYESEKYVPATITQRNLWLQQLRASGNAPDTNIDELFVRHTLLILITRLIIKTIRSDDNNITAGFVQWVSEDSEFVRGLAGIINQYNWRHRSIDILRGLYGSFVDAKHRRSFGEYYTPDWLAEHVCSKVIDDKYIEEQLVNFRKNTDVMGVLDPFCGSGTFLVHAVRRILNSHPLTKAALSDYQKNDFISQMIHGMDIHPVAVEMSRGNMQRLLPTVAPTAIHVYQGDSMLITRSEGSVLSNGGDNMFLESPKGHKLVIPKNFLRSNDNIRTFVLSARDGNILPTGITSGLEQHEQDMIKESHQVMTKIIQEEQNGVWYWYIVNQAAPILLNESKVGRIVSNPPWVALQEIQHKPRKDEIERIAKDEGLFVGGTVAGKFDIAMLAVRRSIYLYMIDTQRRKMGFVLPQGAMLGAGNWRHFTHAYGRITTDELDLGRLPFHNTPTCVVLMDDKRPEGKKQSRKTYRMRKGIQRVKPQEGWSEVKKKLQIINVHEFPKQQSEYVGRHGASLQPMTLVRIKTKTINKKTIQFTTYSSFKTPWKSLGSRSGEVPTNFVKNTLISAGMFPFYGNLGSNIIPILEDGQWDPLRNRNKYWKTAQSLYENYKGLGGNTPQTLEARLDHMGELTRQIGAKKHRVAYNSVGDYLYATVIPNDVICGVGIVYVGTAGSKESRFLSALFNADCLHDAFVAAQKTDRNFHMHILNEIPLPKFNTANSYHRDILKISVKCEKLARQTYAKHSEDFGEFKMRAEIRNVLHESGLQQELYKNIKKILPRYVVW